MDGENLENINEIQRHALACPALPLCGLAMTEAERILPDVLKGLKIYYRLKIQKTILFRMTDVRMDVPGLIWPN